MPEAKEPQDTSCPHAGDNCLRTEQIMTIESRLGDLEAEVKGLREATTRLFEADQKIVESLQLRDRVFGRADEGIREMKRIAYETKAIAEKVYDSHTGIIDRVDTLAQNMDRRLKEVVREVRNGNGHAEQDA